MKFFVSVLCALAIVLPAAAGHAQSPGDQLESAAALLTSNAQPGAGALPLTLDEVARIALAANPDIEVAARRVALAQAHVPTVGRLDDPQAMYRGWEVPLQKPWDYNAAENMFAISQSFPGAGKRNLQSGVAQSDADIARANLDQARLEVRVRVRKAFDDLLRAQDELRIHDRHVEIARQATEAARIQYANGKVPQQDMLKAQVALTRLAEHMIRFGQDVDVARAELNTLLGRDPASPLSVRGDYAVMADLPAAQSLEELALQTRPDLAAARDAVERSRREQALAKKAYAPDFTVSAGYMLMPTGSNMRNNYMIEGSMSLPWLNRGKHDAEIAESTVRVTEQDAEVTALRNQAFGQIQSALAQAQAAQKMARLYRDAIVPQAEATLESSVVAYQSNKTDLLNLLDSQMAVVDADLAWAQAVGDFNARLADLEMAAGTPLDANNLTLPEVKP